MSQRTSPSAFAHLKSLASETSSEKRRELLRTVTDLFLGDPCERSETECMLFEDVVAAVVSDMQGAVRAELAEKLADTKAPIQNTLKKFAMDDDINVARPILERSTTLTDEDLVEIVSSKTQEHLMAITRRQTVSERVSGAIVQRGSDHVVASLLENDGAIIDRSSMEKIADRAITSETLQKSFVGRDNVPLDLINELMMVVEKDLRAEILNRFESVSPKELDAALAKSRRTIRQNYGKATRQQKAAEAHIDHLEKIGKLKIDDLLKFLQSEDYPAFAECLGRMSGIGYDNAMKIFRDRDIDSLAMTMKALDAPLPLFATVAAYVAGVTNAVDQVKTYAGVYREVPAEAARRAIRFWKVRAATVQAA